MYFIKILFLQVFFEYIRYIMTSDATREQTEQFFEKHSYFGLSLAQVVFFEQGLMPCFTFDGKIILEDSDRIAMAPGKKLNKIYYKVYFFFHFYNALIGKLE